LTGVTRKLHRKETAAERVVQERVERGRVIIGNKRETVKKWGRKASRQSPGT